MTAEVTHLIMNLNKKIRSESVCLVYIWIRILHFIMLPSVPAFLCPYLLHLIILVQLNLWSFLDISLPFSWEMAVLPCLGVKYIPQKQSRYHHSQISEFCRKYGLCVINVAFVLWSHMFYENLKRHPDNFEGCLLNITGY